MKLRATVKIRNDAMISARERLGLSQAALGEKIGVSVVTIMRYEKMDYPRNFNFDLVYRIAEALSISMEEVMPEEMVGWSGQTKFTKKMEIETRHLLEWQQFNTDRLMLPSPSEVIEGAELRRIMRKEIDKLPTYLLSLPQREVMKLRYGLNNDGFFYTTEETARILKVTKERVRRLENDAIRRLKDLVKYKESKLELG